jgi:hypothetical protein
VHTYRTRMTLLPYTFPRTISKTSRVAVDFEFAPPIRAGVAARPTNPAPHRKSVTFHERVGALAPVFEPDGCALPMRGGRCAPDKDYRCREPN